MDTTGVPHVSPPLATPQTPHFPGYFPSSAATSPHDYDQSEPPLDAAGRALPLPSGSVLLGAAAGLLLAGPLGAAAGASLAGLRDLEVSALSSRVGGTQEASAAQKEVGGGLGGVVGEELARGASGAKVVELEVPVYRTNDVDGSVVGKGVDEDKVDQTPKPEPILLAAGAGAAVGGLTASALRMKDLREGDGTTSPIGSDVSTEHAKSEQHQEGDGKLVAGAIGGGILAGVVGTKVLSHDDAEPQSKFHEALPSSTASPPPSAGGFPFHTSPPTATDSTLLAPPVRPTPVSYFSDATFASTSSTESGMTNLSPAVDPYDDQRVVLPIVHAPEKDAGDVSTVATKGSDDEDAEEEEEEEEKPSRAYGTAAIVGGGVAGAGLLAYKGGEESEKMEKVDSTSSWGNETLAALGAGAAVGGTAAYVAHERSSTPPPTERRAGLPHSPKQRDLVHPESIAQRSPPPHFHHSGPHQHEPASPISQIPPVSFASPPTPPPTNPVTHSPHMKIATRKDSIGHNRLHKDSIERKRAASGRERSSSVGEGIWNSSVASVVNNETDVRGQRPSLVSIDTDDRREHVLDRVAGVPDPTSTPHSHPRVSSPAPSSPAQHDTPSPGGTPTRKLTKSRGHGEGGHRRAVSVGSGESSPAGSEKRGFLNKVFGSKPQ